MAFQAPQFNQAKDPPDVQDRKLRLLVEEVARLSKLVEVMQRQITALQNPP